VSPAIERRDPLSPAWRAPLLALGAVALAFGIAAGLARMGAMRPLAPHHLGAHGPLMVGAFLGTVIALERAVALGRLWGYAGPLLSGLAGPWLIARADPRPAAAALTLAAALLVTVFAALLRRHPNLPLMVMTAGAACWLGGNLTWLATGWPWAAVPWWAAFLALTIAGERLELSRILAPGRRALALFWGTVAVLLGGLAALPWLADAGVRTVGFSLAALAFWLLRYDLARRTFRFAGLHRFAALCLVTGYLWLALAGALAAVGGADMGSLLYDAATHAFFVGFVFAMIFAHAPIIAPMLLGAYPGFHPVYYLHWGLLQASLSLRLAGDLGEWHTLRVWGSWGNAAALALFLVVTVAAALVARRRESDQRGSIRA
jgi:hypothetical protein